MSKLGEALTPTEEMIVKHISQGLTNKEIASKIKRSDSSVKNQVASIFSKLGVKNRAEAAIFCNRLNELGGSK